jgi:hypothetical protein
MCEVAEYVTVVEPVAGDALGGTSVVPARLPIYVFVAA